MIDPRITELKFAEVVESRGDVLLSVLRRKGILLVRGAEFDGAGFMSLLKEFGSVVEHAFLASTSPEPGLSVLERPADNVGDMIYGGAWHQNLMFLDNPPDATVLFADSIDDEMNFTAFVDLAEVGPWYSQGVTSLLKSCRAVHSTSAPESPQNYFQDGSVVHKDARHVAQSAIHPCFVSDPQTGISWPFVMSNYVTAIEGWKPTESMPLVRALRDFATFDEFVIRHYWRKGDLVLWDNRRYMHRATVTHKLGTRRLWRGDLILDWSLTPGAY